MYRTIASEHVHVLGAVYSIHLTIREARLCYMRALVGCQVFFIQHDGLSESAVSPEIPLGWKLKAWWSYYWRAGGGAVDQDVDEELPVPSICP